MLDQAGAIERMHGAEDEQIVEYWSGSRQDRMVVQNRRAGGVSPPVSLVCRFAGRYTGRLTPPVRLFSRRLRPQNHITPLVQDHKHPIKLLHPGLDARLVEQS